MPSHSCSVPPDHRLVGDPVDTLTGAVFDRKLEFRLTGPLELWWYRHYDSSCNHQRLALGWGHTHDFDRVLRFDGDGINYEAPVGRVFRFPRLEADENEVARHGFVLRRCSPRHYELHQHGEPAMEFEFQEPTQPARLRRLFRGQHQIQFRYGAARRLEQIIDSAGRILSVVEEANGRLQSVTLKGAQGTSDVLLVAYQYDERGNLIATRNESGHGYAFTYNDANRMLTRRGRKGFRFLYAYDKEGRCIKATGDEGLYEVAPIYKVPRRVTKVRRGDGGEWTYFFDGAGGLTKVVDPLGGARQFVRDETGRVILELDPNENATRFTYNAAGAPIAKLTAPGNRVALPEDPNAPNPLAHRVAANPAEYEYGRLLKVAAITLPTQAQLQGLPLSWESRSLVFVQPLQNHAADPARQFEVRPLGMLWWPEPKRGWVFNDFGKLVQQRDDFGRTRHWTYDPSGNIASHVDFDGGKWNYDYASWHFLRRLTDPLGASVRFSYTTNGQMASCVDAGETRTEYRYDLRDHLIEVRRHGVVRETYIRDATGNLAAKNASDGRALLRFEIGPGNLPIKRTLASGDEHTFSYDKTGRYLVAATKKDQVEFAYDALGNCTLEKRNGEGITHRYYCWRKPAESTFLGRFTVRCERHGRTLVISDPGGKLHKIVFHRNGLVERLFSNGSRETSQYDNLGRCLFKLADRKNGQIWSRRYHWSGEGELQKVEDNRHGEVRHEYDTAHRLKRRFVNGQVENYEMDPADNLIAQPGLKEVSLESGNRLGTANGSSFVYNDRNHVESRHSSVSPIRYAYDSRDQLIRIEMPEGVWEAEYDALGRRTRKRWAGNTTEYYWNADQLIAERRADGHLRVYVYTDPLAVTPLLFLDYESLEAAPESGRRYILFTDQIGTPRLIEDERGADVWSANIAPFGGAILASNSKIELNIRFPGHYLDPEIGLHYNRYRYYDHRLGRYLQSDPWGLAGGYNLYAYRTNPLLRVDVRGLGEENDPHSPCRQDDEEGMPRSQVQAEEPLPRLGQQEGQDIVNTIHGALPEDSIAARNSTTTLTETQDGTLIVTNSDRVTPEMRQTIAEMQEPGGPLDGRTVLVPDDQHNPGYIPPADRDLPPQGPNNTPTGAENHGEQRGIQAANHYDEHGDANGQGHGPADSQWSRSEAGHQGQACAHCAAAQRDNNVHNPTGVDPNG